MAESDPGDVEANVARAVSTVEDAAAREVELLVFGELYLPGYHPPTLSRTPGDCDTPPEDARLAPLRDAARRAGVAVLAGASIPEAGQRYIGTLLFDPDGGVRDVYHKQNLCGDDENALFAPGTHGSTIVYKGWRLGLGICYDASFPEHARAAALDGCHAYVTSGAFNSHHRRDLYHSARALDNTFYVVFSNGRGGAEPWALTGGSAVYDPQGEAVSTPATESFVVGDLDFEEIRRTRDEHTMLADLTRGESPRHFTEL